METKKSAVDLDFIKGILSGKPVTSYKKLYAEAKAYYGSIDPELSEDTVMYEVYYYANGEHTGNLNLGITDMKPVTVNGECNVTHGHFHQNRDCDEIYIGLAGNGLLLYMNDEGHCWSESVRPGSVHYISGKDAHRLINTGDEDMRVLACWPADSGHDYEAIDKKPFGVRVFKRNGKIKIEEK